MASLWNVLDDAGCGHPVGIDDFNLRGSGDNPEQQTILAVDLSIWICEGMSSTALSSFHADPALYLVYQRTMKLLKLGLGLVFVMEGQRRVRSQTIATSSTTQTHHELKQRRSGSQFWDACKRCETLLKCLGVPVVRAEAEGEALCALLNSSGIVDGVISNDGDCLLFGCKTIYTNFSSENLENRQVMRYDKEKLVANLGGGSGANRTIKLHREDLVAFAMLCGSDMCGGGISNCGPAKAIQFLHACKSLKQHTNERTCLDELLSWSDEASAAAFKSKEVCIDCDDDGPCTVPLRCCSLCQHPGDKRSHEKHGCVECGTGPGEGCFVVTQNEKILRSMKEKAMRSIPPRNIVNGYFAPNSNNIPSSLTLLKSKPYSLQSADPEKLFTTTSLILKGRTVLQTNDYIKQTLPQLLARLDLWDTAPRNRYANTKQRYKPIPARIEKRVVRQSQQCYEMMWSINLNPLSSDENDEPFQFTTVECTNLIDSNFPQLLKAFKQEERRKLQGRNEEERQRKYGGLLSNNNNAQQRKPNQRPDFNKPHAGKRKRVRERNFDAARVSKVPKKSQEMMTKSTGLCLGNDVSMLIDNMPNELPKVHCNDVDHEDNDVSEQWEEAPNDDLVKYNLTQSFSVNNDEYYTKGDDIGGIESYSQDKAENDSSYSRGLKSSEENHEDDHNNELNDHLDDILENAWHVNTQSNHDTDDGGYADDYLYSYDDHNQQSNLISHPHYSLHHDGMEGFGLNSGDHVENEYQYQQNSSEQYKDQVWERSGGIPPPVGGGYHDNDADCAVWRADRTLDLRLLSNERVYCDFGIDIEITPIMSRKRYTR